MENVIEIKNLFKSFGEVKAVNDLSFKVKRGELFAFLGENGAGKSTTINIICGQLPKDGGSVEINGMDADKNPTDIKSKIGVVFQNSCLDQALTVFDNLENRASLYGIVGEEFNKKLSELIEIFSLEEILKRRVGKLSGGQRRKVDFARALINDPEILILDEPTTGLDPQTRKKLWEVVENLRKIKKTTVFLTTHYMEEAAEADYVVILDKGKISAQGTPYELKNKYVDDYLILYGIEEEQVVSLGLKYEKGRNYYKIPVSDTKSVTNLIVNNSEIFNDYEIIKGKMDDVFLAVTGKKLTGESDK